MRRDLQSIVTKSCHPGGNRLLPFVRHFHGSPVNVPWEDQAGVTPLDAHVAVQKRLGLGERIFGFLDDV